uniref:SEC11 homolog A, signal peptidase complex subunit n=1 Tax=Falco tinnunculus TaxID=100819 RepID=A0A8C4V1R3_FALTI
MLSLDFLDDVRRMNKRQLYYQVLNFGMIVSSALMIWKGLMVVTGSESPIVVVLSGSMEPAFHRGDLLFLTNRIEDPIRLNVFFLSSLDKQMSGMSVYSDAVGSNVEVSDRQNLPSLAYL